MLRSVEFARNHGVPLHVRSSFTWEPGTWSCEEDATMEQAIVTAVTDDTSEAKVTVTRRARPARHRRAAVPRARRPVDQRRHDRAEHLGERPHRHLVHRRARRPRADDRRVRGRRPRRSAPRASSSDDGIGRVSLVGAGMKSHPGVTAQDVRDARRRGHQHRDDLDVADPHLVRDPRRARRGRRSGASRRVRARGVAP